MYHYTEEPAALIPTRSTKSLFKIAFTRRQWLSLIICALANFGCAVCVSLQAPFFPREAELKGISPTVYGLVFGSFSLTVFLVAPIIGKYVGVIGPRFTLNAGIFITSTCCILFGTLGNTASTPFIVLSFIVRIVEAIGEAAYTTASFTIVAEEFPEHIGTSFAIIRAAFGTGLILGPTLGAFLYKAGGYFLPFASMGGLLFVIAIATKFTFCCGRESKPPEQTQSIIRALRIPTVFWTAVVTCSAASSVGFLSVGLERHLESLGLTTVEIGLMFAISGSVFAATSVFWGWLCEGRIHPKILTTLGFAFICITYLLMGPPPFMPFSAQVWLCALALVFHGLGMGGELLAPYVDAIHSALLGGFPDNLDTYSMIGGLWSSTFQLGNFIGPSLGGFMIDELGFEWSSVVFLGWQIFMGVVTLSFYIVTESCGRRTVSVSQEESTPLIENS